MKRVVQSIMLILVAAILCGCNSFQINGIENFNENDCCFGLNASLMPNNHDFLSTYEYENGNYQYWRNDFGKVQAKTFVQLFYAEEIYQQAKLACHEYFTVSEEKYIYEDFSFYGINLAGGNTSLNPNFPGFRLWGYDDTSHSLVFIGYISDQALDVQITQSDFSQFINTQFGEWLIV